MTLPSTGERMVAEHYQSSPEDHVIYLMHAAAYDFAEPYAAGRRVFDFGCGTGYGAALMAKTALAVTAVDIALDALAFARSRFARGNLRFAAVDAARPLPIAGGSVDLVSSMQVFEHLVNPDLYLLEARRILAPGGHLILVTPDRRWRLLPGQRPWNRWHVREYDEKELARLVGRHFEHVETWNMSATPEVAAIDRRRCRRMRWLTLPFTLPLVPDRWRLAALDLVHRLRRPASRRPRLAQRYGFGVADLPIARGASPSLNLVVLAS